ncbi:MAG TPA: ATP-binding cassette domain-containing protein, partial [Gemmatimonadaceae bacterium]
MSDSAAARSVGAVLTLSNITKRYGTTLAVDDVTMRCERGRVHALLGENGAGKTTLMRIAFGLASPDAGTVTAGDRHLATTADAIAAGVGMVHQHFTNVPAMTVAENVALGGHGRFHARTAAERIKAIGERTGLTLDPNARAGQLSVGGQQRLEIVKALAHDARLLILDEPTAVLAPEETEELLHRLRAFANAGNCVVLITHKLREALAIADDVTVLRRGRVSMQSSAHSITIESLTTALLGGEPAAESTARGAAAEGAVVAALERATVLDERGATVLNDATLEIRAGQIVGVAAVEGAGQHALLRLLAGRATPSAGNVRIPAAVAFIPEDRHRDALVLDFSTTENVALKNAENRHGRIQWSAERAHTRTLIAEYDVRG